MSSFFKERESRVELLEWGRSLPNPFSDAPSAWLMAQDKMINVPDGTYLITHADSPRPIVSTYGIGPCIAVGLFAPDSKTASIAHFTISVNPSSLLAVLQNMYPRRIGEELQDSMRRVRAVIRGGKEDNPFSVNLAVRLLGFMASHGMDLYGADLFNRGVINNSFAIDPADGRVFSEAFAHTSAQPLEPWPEPVGNRPILRVYTKDLE